MQKRGPFFGPSSLSQTPSQLVLLKLWKALDETRAVRKQKFCCVQVIPSEKLTGSQRVLRGSFIYLFVYLF